MIVLWPWQASCLRQRRGNFDKRREFDDRVVARSRHPEQCFAKGIECDLDQLALIAGINPLAAVAGSALLSSQAGGAVSHHYESEITLDLPTGEVVEFAAVSAAEE